ncbi:unnamed protein product [Brassicogethes aeneus]|uniref:Uncharacterized protein n=1 Tax=Brassicogethes aeneus TaxID=1431903 RepID=A0A9P0BH39_BRAAE|nr:unnamed protein product [Brassicogethes aeneus]
MLNSKFVAITEEYTAEDDDAKNQAHLTSQVLEQTEDKNPLKTEIDELKSLNLAIQYKVIDAVKELDRASNALSSGIFLNYQVMENLPFVRSRNAAEIEANNLKRKANQKSIQKYMKKSVSRIVAPTNVKKQLDIAVTMFVIRDLQPLCVVEDSGFVNIIMKLDPRFSLPSRRHLRDVLTTKTYEGTVENIS